MQEIEKGIQAPNYAKNLFFTDFDKLFVISLLCSYNVLRN